jgi:hypothetical protein
VPEEPAAELAPPQPEPIAASASIDPVDEQEPVAASAQDDSLEGDDDGSDKVRPFVWHPSPEATPAVAQLAPGDADALARIERRVNDTAEALALLFERLERVLTMVERTAAGAAPPPAPARPQAIDDDYDAPILPRVSSGPPRPAILRDPAPQTATAEHLEADVIDTRPLPKPLPPIQVESKRGLDLLPRTYRITVEDKRRGVDLVPLHRALLSMDGVKDMSLLSYNNGVAIVALETVNDIESDVLGQFVSRAMSRDAKVEVHNEHTMVVKLAED